MIKLGICCLCMNNVAQADGHTIRTRGHHMYKISPYLLLNGAFLSLIGCVTPEYQAAQNSCSTTWMQKIPPRYEQEMYNQLQSTQVPTGQTTCMATGYIVTCNQIMRTQYYSTPAVRTVDRNADRRNAEIQSCTASICVKQYGNAACETG